MKNQFSKRYEYNEKKYTNKALTELPELIV